MALGMPKKLVNWLTWQERHTLIEFFCKVMKPSEEDILLEIGGPTGGAKQIVSLFKKVIVINLNTNRESLQRCNYPEDTQIIVGDGCMLPLKNESVDFLFCNATLEHIPKELWEFLAQEVARVALKGFFISAPNYWFPFEPHYLMPFFQFMPEGFKRKLIINYGLTIGHISQTNYSRIHLPKKRELQRLFPDALVEGVGWGIPLIIPIHWVCWEKKG